METHILRVKELLATGLTQQSLGELIGRSQAWVSSLINGKFSDIKWSEGEALRKLHAERCNESPASAGGTERKAA